MPLVQRKSATATRTRPAHDEDERPARRARASEEDERPARRRRAAEPEFVAPDDDAAFEPEDEPAERPARRARRSGGDDDPPARSRRRTGGDEDDERPASDAVQSGWGAANKLKKEGGNFANEMSITNDPQLVKFLDDAPYAVYKQHWVEGLRSTGKKSFICMGKGCPLCSIGESAAKKWAFNVAVLEDDDWVVYSLIAGSRLFDNIADEHEGADGPLNEGFWTLSKSGKKSSTTYKLKKLEGRKLEDYLEKENSEFTNEDELLESFEDATITPYTAKQHQPPTKSYLQEIADEAVGEDD